MNTGIIEKPVDRKRKIPLDLIRTYWRAELIRHLRKPEIVTSIILAGKSLQINSVSWNEYWQMIPLQFKNQLEYIKENWRQYINSGFQQGFQHQYSKAVLETLDEFLKMDIYSSDKQCVISTLLGLETFH